METIKNIILNYVYVISNQPVKLQDLLNANRSYNEGLNLDGTYLGFRLRLGRAYLVFLLLVNVFLLIPAYLGHKVFQDMDCHLSIFVVMLLTGVIFASFGLFKDWLSDAVALKRIKIMWALHFPLFQYEEYNKEINTIFIKSIEEDIKKPDLEKYILEQLTI